LLPTLSVMGSLNLAVAAAAAGVGLILRINASRKKRVEYL
jgi:hypothetical protein